MHKLVLLLCVVVLGQGCGDGLTRVPIQGLVKAQGSPLGNAMIQFTPKAGTVGDGALGMSDSDGVSGILAFSPNGFHIEGVLCLIDQ